MLPIQLLINLCVAALWMFLQDEWNVLTFISGYLVGIVVLFMIRRFFPHPFYLKTMLAVVHLLIVFIRELVTSSFLVLKQVVRPKIDVKPGIFRLKTNLEGQWEIPLLALLLSLTPGSVVVEISSDNKIFYIHALDINESKKAIIKSKKVFEKAIKEVTR